MSIQSRRCLDCNEAFDILTHNGETVVVCQFPAVKTSRRRSSAR